MSPDEQSLVQRRPFGGYGVWTGLGQACSGSKSEDTDGVSLPVVHPGAPLQAQDHADPLDSAVPEQLSDDALATLRESLSNVVRNAEADAGTCVSRGGHDRQDADPPGGRQRGGHRPQVTLGRRNTAARARASGGHATVVRRSEPGTTFTWVALPLEGKWEQITDAAGGNPAVCAHFQRAAMGIRTLVRTRWTVGP